MENILEEKKSKAKTPLRLFCIALVLILISCVGASVLQTSFGAVRMIDLNLATDHQQTLHAIMFIPKTASAENKLPVVITSHGWLNSAEVQDAASIELSRRGVVVIAMDAYSHGMSSNIYDPEGRSAQSSKDAMGMIALVEYVSSGVLDYIDTSHIGVMGHSMGGNNAFNTIRHYGRLYKAAIEEAQSPDSEGGAEITEAEQAYADSLNKVYAAFPTGSKPTYQDGRWEEIFCNVGVLYGAYEEGGYSSTTGTADISGEALESLEMMNFNLEEGEEPITYVELGKYYGDMEKGTLRVLYQPEVTHPWIHFSTRATANVIEYFDTVFGLDDTLGQNNQIWNIKEAFNFVGLIGIFLLLVPMAELLLKVPCFAELKKPCPPKLPALTASSKKLFWGGWLLGGAVSFVTAVLAMPVYRAIFADTVAGKPSIFFAASTTNCIMVWTFFNAVFGMFWFWFIYKKVNSQNGVTMEMIGWKISRRELLKTIGLAVTIITIVYVIIAGARWLFFTDFRIWTPALKTFRPDKLIQFVGYFPVFFLFYLANSLSVNGAMRVDGMSERKNLFICALGNILGATLLWAIQYGKLLATGTVLWGPEWIDVLVIAFCIPQLFIAAYLGRYFFKATGKVWLGAMVNSSIMLLMGVMHNCITGIFV
jgi:hypothetical protein